MLNDSFNVSHRSHCPLIHIHSLSQILLVPAHVFSNYTSSSEGFLWWPEAFKADWRNCETTTVHRLSPRPFINQWLAGVGELIPQILCPLADINLTFMLYTGSWCFQKWLSLIAHSCNLFGKLPFMGCIPFPVSLHHFLTHQLFTNKLLHSNNVSVCGRTQTKIPTPFPLR